MERRTIQVVDLEIAAPDEATALAKACTYLAGRFGPQAESFLPAPHVGRGILPPRRSQ